jgi:hypothetical protein
VFKKGDLIMNRLGDQPNKEALNKAREAIARHAMAIYALMAEGATLNVTVIVKPVIMAGCQKPKKKTLIISKPIGIDVIVAEGMEDARGVT